MELTLVRKYFKEKYTVGQLSIDGKYFCDTLEDKARELQDLNHDGDFTDPGEGKIYGQTAIPCGRYRVVLGYWQKHKRYVPCLLAVPGFTGIMMHSGRNADHTLGCILVGENKLPGELINAPYTETSLTHKIRVAIRDRKEEVWITIKM
jgi:hypothetical protein